jgi:catechol 2,3-dioxygenase-like lactoylglutathione lyase family enzyme
MTKAAHHVVVHSHDAETFVRFLTEAIGMPVLHKMDVTSEMLEATMGWPPNDGTRLWVLGEGDHGLVEVVDVPPSLRDRVRDGLAVLSFTTRDLAGATSRAAEFAAAAPEAFDTGIPGVDAALCDIGGVQVELMQFGGG